MARKARTMQPGRDLVRSRHLAHRDRPARLRVTGRALDRLRADSGAIAATGKMVRQCGVSLVRMDEMKTAGG